MPSLKLHKELPKDFTKDPNKPKFKVTSSMISDLFKVPKLEPDHLTKVTFGRTGGFDETLANQANIKVINIPDPVLAKELNLILGKSNVIDIESAKAIQLHLDNSNNQNNPVKEYLKQKDTLSHKLGRDLKFSEFELGWDYTGSDKFREGEMMVALKIKEQYNVELYRCKTPPGDWYHSDKSYILDDVVSNTPVNQFNNEWKNKNIQEAIDGHLINNSYKQIVIDISKFDQINQNQINNYIQTTHSTLLHKITLLK